MSLANIVGRRRVVRKVGIAPLKEECIGNTAFFWEKEEREHTENEMSHLNSVTSVKIILANSSTEFGLLINLIHLKISILIVKLRIWGNIYRSYLTIFFRQISSSAGD